MVMPGGASVAVIEGSPLIGRPQGFTLGAWPSWTLPPAES